jgi:hypothetical protein
MRSPVIAIVLCIFSAAASAQCVAQAPLAAAVRPGGALIKTAIAGTGERAYKTAAAGTGERALPPDDGLPMIRETATATKRGEDQPPRRVAGPAMLLAALAVMSGIALRRYSAPRQ